MEETTQAAFQITKAEETGFITYARSFVTKMQDDGRYDAAHKLNTYIGRFIAYLGKNEIPVKDFDSLLIRNYRTWLENRNLGHNSISLYIRNLKRVYQLAVEEGLTKERRPFEGVDVSYHVKRQKTGLTLEEVKRLKQLDLSKMNASINFARDIFLFSVYTQGMTADEIFHLTKDNIKDGYLTYTSKTTGRQETIQWSRLHQDIVDKYTKPNTPYLFPIITAEDKQGQWRQHCATLHKINRNLKTIGKLIGLQYPLNMTVAHHTWKSMMKSLNVGDLL